MTIFLTIAEDLLESNQTNNMNQITNTSPLSDLLKSHSNSYPITTFRYTSIKEIEKIIISLKSKDALGCDEITTKVLKWSAPLTYVFNKSIEKGVFPSRLKYSTIIPIFKTGDKLNMSNFRPISLLISFSKILEVI